MEHMKREKIMDSKMKKIENFIEEKLEKHNPTRNRSNKK